MIERMREALSELEEMHDAMEGAVTLDSLADLNLSQEQAELAILGLFCTIHALDGTLEHMERSE